jgi:hypothetical protein
VAVNASKKKTLIFWGNNVHTNGFLEILKFEIFSSSLKAFAAVIQGFSISVSTIPPTTIHHQKNN